MGNLTDQSTGIDSAATSLQTDQDHAALHRQLKRFSPWRMSIQVTDQFNTGELIELAGKDPAQCKRSRDNARVKFLTLIDSLYPDGLSGKRFMDCGCNAGGYCFWVRERGAEIGYGFDAREHWIKQARVVKNKRTVGPKDRIQLEVCTLHDLPAKDLNPFDIVQFKGLFYHLADPISGLKIAADLCRDVLIFQTAFLWDEIDGALVQQIEEPDLLHGGLENLAWFPTGPEVCTELIRSLGFDDLKLTSMKQVRKRPERGRLQIIAARDRGRLKDLTGEAV